MTTWEKLQLEKMLQVRANMAAKQLPMPSYMEIPFLASKYGATIEYVKELATHIKPNRFIFGDDS